MAIDASATNHAKPVDLDALAREIREVNTANGWNVTRAEEWEDRYKFPAILALIHSEITEAEDARQASDRTNLLEEFADVAIRVLDCVGCWDDLPFSYVVRSIQTDGVLFPPSIVVLHSQTSGALEAFRVNDRNEFVRSLANVFAHVEFLCEFHGGDLYAEIDEKLAKNRERGHRHGGKKV